MKNTVEKRKTPRAKRPACELWPQAQIQANPHVRVYNPAIIKTGEIINRKNGILLVRYDNGLSILRFSEDPDGTIRWVPRSVRSKDRKQIIYIYDRIDVQKKMIPLLIEGLKEYMEKAEIPPDVTTKVLVKRKEKKQEYDVADLAKKVFT